MDGIIGLPDILDHYLDIFIDILESGRYSRGDAEDSLHLTELEDLERKLRRPGDAMEGSPG